MDIIDKLKKFGINSIFHFTDESNLESIMTYGLQSLHNIESKHIEVPKFGADSLSHDLDAYYGLDKFVHLSFVKDHPMYHVSKRRSSITNPIWIEYDISLLLEDATIFSNQVANCKNTELFTINKLFENIDFTSLSNYNDFQKGKEARKAEIMVFDSININKIR